MASAPSVPAELAAERLLDILDPEQRAAALLGRGVASDRIGVVTFNRDAAAELAARIASRPASHVPGAEAIEVRTLHAMARQVLVNAGRPVRQAADRRRPPAYPQ